MPQQKPQSNASHARWDPPFHFFLMPVAVITVALAAYNVIRRFTFADLWLLVLAFAFAVTVYRLRTYPLKAQDRIIRLEEKLRMQRVLPAAMQSRIGELQPAQFVAMRFAPDEELPNLVEQTLSNRWGPKDIKAAIKDWRADHFRV
ncbi:MAG: DUF6526 family protein [Acidobacteriota bacterium]|nr:DUF6526 family protein [Acidobacteriota bacterium]